MKQFEELSLEAIASGKAVDQVNFQLAKMIENCLDPNTDPTAVRKVTLTITTKPSSDRDTAAIAFKVETKFQGDAPGVELVHISRSGKKGYVNKAQQLELEDALGSDGEPVEDSNGNVVGMAPRKDGTDDQRSN